MSERREHNIKQLGQCLKMTRQMHGQTQAGLAKILSISPQQIQKYELGLNRIPADVILSLARELEISITAFFPSDESTAVQGLQLTDDCFGMLPKLMSLDVKQKSLVVDLVEQLTHSGAGQGSDDNSQVRTSVE